MNEPRIIKYYVFMNNAYLYKSMALPIWESYSHKGEKITEIFVIVENEKVESSFCLDACFYNYFDNYDDAKEEIFSWD